MEALSQGESLPDSVMKTFAMFSGSGKAKDSLVAVVPLRSRLTKPQKNQLEEAGVVVPEEELSDYWVDAKQQLQLAA